MKVCSKCGEKYPNTLKYFKVYRPGKLRCQCRECWNEAKAKRARKYYEEWMFKLIPAYLKVERLTCNRCGYDKHAEVIEFHHTDSEKKDRMISGLVRSISPWGLNTQKVYNEIDKCEILCPTCHREEHLVKI